MTSKGIINRFNKFVFIFSAIFILVFSSGCIGGKKSETDPSKLFQEGKTLIGDARDALGEGRKALYSGEYVAAKKSFAEANSFFKKAKSKFDKGKPSAQGKLKEKLINGSKLSNYYKKGTLKMKESVEAYLNGNNATAEKLGKEAQNLVSKAKKYQTILG